MSKIKVHEYKKANDVEYDDMFDILGEKLNYTAYITDEQIVKLDNQFEIDKVDEPTEIVEPVKPTSQADVQWEFGKLSPRDQLGIQMLGDKYTLLDI